MRALVAETRLHPANLIQAHFVVEGKGRKEPIESLPRMDRMSVDVLVDVVAKDLEHGIRSVMLFAVPSQKDDQGSGALDPAGAVPQAVQALKERFGDELLVMADVCLCPFTDHGHCGLVEGESVENDASVVRLAEMSVVLARAGVDVVCPSDMMDGRVAELRAALDREGFEQTSILAYSAKYASAFYGPFRDAAGSSPEFGDRKTYQMDSRNRREAIREVQLDLAEGADMVMVKPALAYLDVISDAAEQSTVPVVAYNVSGEYAMVQLAVQAGIADERAMTMEILHAIKRAGADSIVTYHASEVARQGWLD